MDPRWARRVCLGYAACYLGLIAFQVWVAYPRRPVAPDDSVRTEPIQVTDTIWTVENLNQVIPLRSQGIQWNPFWLVRFILELTLGPFEPVLALAGMFRGCP